MSAMHSIRPNSALGPQALPPDKQTLPALQALLALDATLFVAAQRLQRHVRGKSCPEAFEVLSDPGLASTLLVPSNWGYAFQ